MSKNQLLSVSQRPRPDGEAWLHETRFLFEAGINSDKTAGVYRTALRLFADWLQHFHKPGYHVRDPWPLSPAWLSTQIVLEFASWLLTNRARSTAFTYMAGVTGYLIFIDALDCLPPTVCLDKLERQLRRRMRRRHRSTQFVDLDAARQAIPQIVTYYDTLPLPQEPSAAVGRLLVLRNRAIVNVLYSSGMRIAELVSLDRRTVRFGCAEHAMIRGKGGRLRAVHVREYAKAPVQVYLAERKDKNPALFVSHSRNARNSRLSVSGVHLVIKRAVSELGLDPRLSAHDFRHFRASQLLRQGVPLEVVQEFLGHADFSTTRNIYAPVLGVLVVKAWLDQVDGGG